MIAAWMLYAILVASIVGAAALTVDYALRALRKPVRFVWIGAMLLAVLLPGIQFVLASTSPLVAASRAPTPLTVSDVSQNTIPEAATHVASSAWSSFDVPPTLRALDVPLLGIWLGLSILWASVLLVSARRLRRQSSAWEAAIVDGTPVYVSHDIGPALFGISRYSIVVPAWVLSLDGRQRQLLLAHEREHARTSDPVMLAAGALLVVLQPWNPAVWLMFHRLRFALELDCDARVLARMPDPRAYGELLVEVGSRTLAGAAPIAAFSEPHSLLRRRITMITSRPVSHPAARGIIALMAGGLATLAACYVPRPATVVPEASIAEGPVVSSPSQSEMKRVIVRVTHVGLKGVSSPPKIMFFTTGAARVGIGLDAPTLLTDTLRLSSLPAFTADVTNGDVHVQLIGAGEITIGAIVSGGPATSLSATGRHIVLHQGGRGVVAR